MANKTGAPDPAAAAAKPDRPDAAQGVIHPERLSPDELVVALRDAASSAGAAALRDLLAEAADRLTLYARAAALYDAQAAAAGAPVAELPMIVDGIVHVMRNETLVEIKGPKLVSATDLTPVEIDELTALRAIRVASMSELHALSQPSAETTAVAR
jgi:hypothetical protein